jgi:hypothetical protein
MIPELPRMDDLLSNLKQKGYEVSNRGIKIGSFGDSVELSSKLLELVRDGVKTATASLVWEWEAEGQTLPAVGDVMIVLDSALRNMSCILPGTGLCFNPSHYKGLEECSDRKSTFNSRWNPTPGLIRI